ncbi:hypothetical protein [Biomaibacter acetigenes]|uniref:hypothetical protein n=1 Tax=Biomaibacter acetigenes TaxID=2316383 RepID=UPI001CA4506D|nr:hypothetical protein [Biomaibacter acetigenes]
MNHKELLQQYTDLQAEIKDLEDRIRKLENQADKIVQDSVIGSDPHFPYTERSFHIEGYSDKKQRRLSRLKNF